MKMLVSKYMYGIRTNNIQHVSLSVQVTLLDGFSSPFPVTRGSACRRSTRRKLQRRSSRTMRCRRIYGLRLSPTHLHRVLPPVLSWFSPPMYLIENTATARSHQNPKSLTKIQLKTSENHSLWVFSPIFSSILDEIPPIPWSPRTSAATCPRRSFPHRTRTTSSWAAGAAWHVEFLGRKGLWIYALVNIQKVIENHHL